jgi:hypothetical protein
MTDSEDEPVSLVEEQKAEAQNLQQRVLQDGDSKKGGNTTSEESTDASTHTSVNDTNVEETSDAVQRAVYPKCLGKGKQMGYIYMWAGNITFAQLRYR